MWSGWCNLFLIETKGFHKGEGKMNSKTYAELVAEVSVTVTPNDAAFLAVLVTQYIAKGNNTDHLQQLVAHLTQKAGC